MAKIILIVDESVSYENLNRNRLELVKFLKQKGLPITMSYVEDSRQNDLIIEKPCQTDIPVVSDEAMTTPDVSGATSTTPNVSMA